MQFNIENRSGENLVLLAANNYFDGNTLANYISDLDYLLNDINKDNWIESVDPVKVNNLLAAIKNGLTPMLNYIGVLLNDEVRTIDNIWRLPRYLYAIGITPAKLRSVNVRDKVAELKDGITLNFNIFDVGSRLSNAINGRLVIESGGSGNGGEFTDVLKNALMSGYSLDDVSEPSNNVVYTSLAHNLYDYIMNVGQVENYNSGYDDGYKSVPLASVILLFTIIIIVIVVVAIIVIWLVNVFKKNNVNVNVVGSKIEPEAAPEIII